MGWLEGGGGSVDRGAYAKRLRDINAYVRGEAGDLFGSSTVAGSAEEQEALDAKRAHLHNLASRFASTEQRGETLTGDQGLYDTLLGEMGQRDPTFARNVVTDYATMGRGLWSPYIKKLISDLYERKGGAEMTGNFLQAAIDAGFIPGE